MLPYSSAGVYGGSPYGRRKGFLGSQYTFTGALALVALVALGFSVFTHFRASSVGSQNETLKQNLESVQSELHSVKVQFSSRNAELDQLQYTYGHAQRRLVEVQSQLQRKEIELRGVNEQQRSGREAELTKMVEDLREELLRSDGVIEALDAKVAAMEGTHASREKDWHILANKWIKYEEALHEHYKKCTAEVSKLRNITMAMNDTAPIPEAEPKLREETDFALIHPDIPAHKPHRFDPLPPSPPVPVARTTPGDLPLPEAKIRESIAHMTNGEVGGDHDPTPQAPEPYHIHHQDTYHQDFHNEDHHYDHYHGHYESYDPLDEWWVHDGHGDWNAGDQGHGHGHGHGHDHVNEDDTHQYHDQNHHQQYNPRDNHHIQHHHEHQEVHKDASNSHDTHHHDQHRHHYQETRGGGLSPELGQHHNPQLPAMQGMETHWDHAHAHAQHPPSPLHVDANHHDHHQQPQHQQHQHQQHQQHYQEPHHQQQQQQYGDAHAHQHPGGDLAYKVSS